MKRLLPLFFLLRVLRAAEIDNDPETERQSFHLAPGFEANLFASEAEGVVKPIQIRWDPLGRLWVIGSRTYPQIIPGEEPNDQVLILEDPEHHGHVEKVTVFADGLMIPTGLEVDGDGRGAWVGEGTKLWHLRDPQGTGRATQKEVVLRGFGTGDNHQNINSFLWSPVGDLLFCQGLHGFARVETKAGIVPLDEAGFWRFHPPTGRLQSFFGGKADPQNPWGWAFTDGGQPLLVAGNNGGIFYPVPEMIEGHDQTRAGNIWVNARARKTSGPDIVGTTHLPPEWQGVMLTGGYINNAVWALKILEDGAGFRVTDLPPLLTSTHPSFRPVDVKIGPDGAIYICDWYNPIIGHYQASFRHPDRDKAHGRIWRITYAGRPLTEMPQIVGAEASRLKTNLLAGDRWTRWQTRRYLATLAEPAGSLAMDTTIPDEKVRDRFAIECAELAATRGEPSPGLLGALLLAHDPDARALAATLAERWHEALPDPLATLRGLVRDEHPRVRLAAIVAAANLRRPESLELALGALGRPLDRFLDSALHQAMTGLKPLWLPQLRAGTLALDDVKLDYLVRHDGTLDTIGPLRKILAAPELTPERRLTLLETLAQVGESADLAELLRLERWPGEEDKVRALRALGGAFRTRGVKAAGEWPAMEGLSAPVHAEALRLAGLYRAPAALELLRAAVRDEALQTAAIDGLSDLGTPEAIASLRELSAPPAELALQVKAVGGLTRVALPAAAARAPVLLREGAPVEALVAPFLERKEGAAELAKTLAAVTLTPAVNEAVLNYLRARGRMDAPLVAALQRGAPTAGRATPEYLAAMVPEVRKAGEARHGEELFHSPRLVCMACHAVSGKGGNIGPSLDAIGTGQPLDFIIGAVLEPQKEVKEGYEAVEITTRDGQIRQGYRVRETADELVLRDLGAGQEVKLARGQITQRRELGSLMPSGLIDGLSHEEQRDLFRYLSELGRPR